MIQWHNRWLISLAIVVLLVLSSFNSLNDIGENYLDGAFKRALVGFAVARGLNGVISVAQGTEFALTPAGMGVNFAPGQILDPINDLVERFSWIMLLSSSALGVQQILLSMSAWQGLAISLVICGVVLIALQWIRRQELQWLQNLILRLFMLLLVLRFMMPLISLTNEWVYRTFLADQYLSASAELERARSDISDINDQEISAPVSENSGLVNRAKELYRSAIGQIDFEKKLEEYKIAAEAISENTIRLIVVFVMQTVVFPLLFLWMIYTLLRRAIH